jgi:N-acylneuraminate cytidylyltransferase
MIAIIPARGGSKGVPGKNIKMIYDKPLICWSIYLAKKSRCFDNIVVTSDDSRILATALKSGASVVKRPKALATDTSDIEPALLHAMDMIKYSGDVMLLQPTSPIRHINFFCEMIDQHYKEQNDTTFSASILNDACIWERVNGDLKSVTYDYKLRGRRQDRKPLLLENGSMYVFDYDGLRAHNNRLYGKIGSYIMPSWASIEIDNPEDFEVCESIMKTYMSEDI